MKISENKLSNIISESIKKVLKENYMSDEDIKAQYNGAKVTHLQVEPSRSGEGWTGTLEIIFPNADDIDFDSSVVDNFFVYDNAGNNIAFDNWYPDVVVAKLKEIIQKEIAKKKDTIKESAGDNEPADIVEEIKDLHNNLNNAILNLGVIEELFEDPEVKTKLQSISNSILTIGREVDQIHSQLMETETLESIFGMEDWANKGLDSLKPGQIVADEVIEELSNNVPPTTYSRGYFQNGEATQHNHSTGEALYLTFKKTKQGWEFVGIKPKL